MATRFGGSFGDADAAAMFAQHVAAADTADMIECSTRDRNRIFNLGYYTWVEQQGIPVEQFDSRKDQAFWRRLQASVPAWDGLIEAFNEKTGTAI